MTVYQCRKCQREFDDKYYLMHKNEIGLTETLISHAKFHEDVERIQENYDKV